MAVGDLEGKIGELNGKLALLAPILEGVGKKVSELAEKAAGTKENLRQVWLEISAIKTRQDQGGRKWWEVALALISAVLGAVATALIMKLMK